jgi:hypothetical protein
MKKVIRDAHEKYDLLIQIKNFIVKLVKLIYSNSVKLLITEYYSSKSVLYKIVLTFLVILSLTGFIQWWQYANNLKISYQHYKCKHNHQYRINNWKRGQVCENITYDYGSSSIKEEISDQEFINSIFDRVNSTERNNEQKENFLSRLFDAFKIPNEQIPLVKDLEVLFFKEDAVIKNYRTYHRDYTVFGKAYVNVLQGIKERTIVFDFALNIKFERQENKKLNKLSIKKSEVTFESFKAYCVTSLVEINDLKTYCPSL